MNFHIENKNSSNTNSALASMVSCQLWSRWSMRFAKMILFFGLFGSVELALAIDSMPSLSSSLDHNFLVCTNSICAIK